MSIVLLFIGPVGPVTYLKTRRGRKCLTYENNLYYANKVLGDNIFWVCSDYYKLKCRGRCVTDINGVLKKLRDDHNHPPQHDKIKEKAFFVKLENVSSAPENINFCSEKYK